MKPLRTWGAACVLLALAGCGTTPIKTAPAGVDHPAQPVLPAAGSGRGAYYKDDGPGENPPPNLEQVPDASTRVEPYSPRANRPYVVFGKTYTPITNELPFTQRGIGSWYGKKFHGQRTSSGELYDMYKMSAAHPTLPIPSYARLTSVVSGKQVVVRINDRGPFHANRVIDVSYTAALKLGLLAKGSHELIIERLLPADIKRMDATDAQAEPLVAQLATPAPAQLLPVAAPLSAALDVAAPEPEALATTVAPNFYVQLGAFSVLENVTAMRLRLAAQTEVFGALEVVQVGAIYRLYSAAFQSREAAARAVQALPGALNLKPIIVQR